MLLHGKDECGSRDARVVRRRSAVDVECTGVVPVIGGDASAGSDHDEDAQDSDDRVDRDPCGVDIHLGLAGGLLQILLVGLDEGSEGNHSVQESGGIHAHAVDTGLYAVSELVDHHGDEQSHDTVAQRHDGVESRNRQRILDPYRRTGCQPRRQRYHCDD